MYACTTCNGCVSRDFVRVFGDNEGTVHACPACAHTTDITNGAGADLGSENRRGSVTSEP